MAQHSLDFWLTSEDLPDPDNRVTLDRDGQIVLAYTPNNERAHKRPDREAEEPADAPRHARSPHPARLFSWANAFRSPVWRIRTGRSASATIPQTSALDVHCRAHDVDNLYVVDGSFFCSSAAVNPALTIAANALRVGDHLLDRLGVGASPVEEAVVRA